jgi:hypothetical protein
MLRNPDGTGMCGTDTDCTAISANEIDSRSIMPGSVVQVDLQPPLNQQVKVFRLFGLLL